MDATATIFLEEQESINRFANSTSDAELDTLAIRLSPLIEGITETSSLYSCLT